MQTSAKLFVRHSVSVALNDGTKWVYTADNEMTGRANGDDNVWNVTVTGEVEPGPNSNKWYNTWAECRGVSARVSTNDGTFSLTDVPVYAGTNELLVTVTDVSGNTSEQTRTVVKECADCLEQFYYDGNGNLTNWVNGAQNWVYEWDWADRMTKASSNGVVMLENWHDASSRRVAKKDFFAQVTNYVSSQYLYDGWNIQAVLSNDGTPMETFTRGLGLAGDIGTLVAVTRIGAPPIAYYTHHNHRGDVIVTRSGTSTTGTYDYIAFGNLQAQTGTDICRFKFSSKERDASTGFSYYGYRFYAPQWQRWINHDPLAEFEDYNLYRAFANNPIGRIDPDGRGLIEFFRKLCGFSEKAKKANKDREDLIDSITDPEASPDDMQNKLSRCQRSMRDACNAGADAAREGARIKGTLGGGPVSRPQPRVYGTN
jgi:RHS repeat-associated protein